MAGVPGEQVPRLNAALLSMVHGVEDAMNAAGVAESEIVEAMEMLSQVGLSQASTKSYYPEDEDNCRADPKLASRAVGAVGGVRVAPSLWQKWVPSDLREVPGVGVRESPSYPSRGVKEMIEAI